MGGLGALVRISDIDGSSEFSFSLDFKDLNETALPSGRAVPSSWN